MDHDDNFGFKNLQIKVSAAEHRLLKLRADAIPLSLQKFARRILSDRLGLTKEVKSSIEDLALHAQLDFILHRGTAEDRVAIQKSVEWAISDIRSRGDKPKRASAS